jgi:hypothetical protein
MHRRIQMDAKDLFIVEEWMNNIETRGTSQT